MPDEGNRASNSATGPSPGKIIAGGRYTLRMMLGKGGMGEVWLARDRRVGGSVALKFLSESLRQDASALEDMARETLKARMLSHPNIVRIHDLVEPTGEPSFISMELVEGSNLASIKSGQPQRLVTWEFLEPLLRQLCQGLHYAHSEGVIHRDLKPVNLMLDAKGRLKLADFGVASLNDGSGENHGVSGTPCYMSPQQMSGKPPQITDDIYALGATVYELLTSKPPFYEGNIAAQTRDLIPEPMTARLVRLGLSNVIPPHIEALVAACLAKDPGSRPQSAEQILKSLDPSATLPEVTPEPAVEETPAEEIPAPALEAVKPPARSRTGFAMAAVVVVIIAIGMGVAWKRPTQSNTVPTPPPPPTNSIPAGPVIAGFEPQADETGFIKILVETNRVRAFENPEQWTMVDGVTRAHFMMADLKPLQAGGQMSDFELRYTARIDSGVRATLRYRIDVKKSPKDTTVGAPVYRFPIGGLDRAALAVSPPVKNPQRVAAGKVAVRNAAGKNGIIAVLSDIPNASPVPEGLYKVGDWNDYIIIARSNRVVHYLNGWPVMDFTDNDESNRNLRGPLSVTDFEGTNAGFLELKNLRVKRF